MCLGCRATQDESTVACAGLVYQAKIQQAEAFDESLRGGPLLADALSDACGYETMTKAVAIGS
jgi:hypothetical protein